MRSQPNIDKSAFRPGTYVGYGANGSLWSIKKMSRAYWEMRVVRCPGEALVVDLPRVSYQKSRLSDFQPILESMR